MRPARVAASGLLVLAACLAPRPAHAVVSCTINGLATVDFGTVSAIDASSTDLAPTFTISCTLANSDLSGSNGSSHALNLCIGYDNGTYPASAGGNRQLASGVNFATFDLYTTSAYNGTHWGARIGLPTGTVVARALTYVKANSGNGTITQTTAAIPIYARLFGGQGTVSFGVHSTSATQTVDAFLDTNASCGAIAVPSATTTSAQTVTANYQANCRVGTISDLDFGTSGFLTSNHDNTTTASVTCTNTTPYTIALGAGTGNGATTATRKLTCSTPASCATSTVGYGLYRDPNRAQNWGNTVGTDTQAGTGNAAAQSYTIYGRVPPQTTPKSGSYQDTVVLTVAF